MMLEEIFVVVMLVIFIIISLPIFILVAFIIICQIVNDKEQNDEYTCNSLQNKDGGGEI